MAMVGRRFSQPGWFIGLGLGLLLLQFDGVVHRRCHPPRALVPAHGVVGWWPLMLSA